MYQLKRGKRPELLKRGCVINQWNECEKTVNNKKLIVKKRNIEIWNIDEDEFFGHKYSKQNDVTSKELAEFGILDLIEKI